MKRKVFRLCFVDDNVMYFTDNYDNQWGDDWDDSPYEHNAGKPYEWRDDLTEDENKHHGHLRYIGFMPDWDLKLPKNGHLNSPYSVEDINNGAVAWCYHKEAGGIMGGATIDDAFKWLKASGMKWGELK